MPVTLISFPLDVFVHVLSYVDPIDIVRLRMTCTALREVSKTRIVWINALLRTCNEDTLYAPSFPITELSTDRLEELALRPTLFSRLVTRKHQEEESLESPESVDSNVDMEDTRIPLPAVEGKPTKRISLKCSDDDSLVQSEWPEIEIVPGGRYVFTLWNEVLSVWDIKFGDEPIDERPVAQTTWTSCTFRLAMNTTGDAIRVLEFDRGEDEGDGAGPMLFRVFEIRPQDQHPVFRQLAQFENIVPIPLDHFFLCGDRLVFVHGEIIRVWDFVKDEWAAWNTGCSEFFQILACPTFIIVVDVDHGTNLTFWKVPETLRANPSADDLWPEDPETPAAVIRLGYWRQDEQMEFYNAVGPRDWYSNNASLPQWFDTLADALEDGYVLRRIEVNNLDHDADGPPQAVQLFDTPIGEMQQASECPMPLESRTCQGKLITPLVYGDGLTCHYQYGNSADQLYELLLDSSTYETDYNVLSFDPASGLLCRLNSSYQISDPCVVIEITNLLS